jgi:uncharacterized protein (TIRG00374 family)
MSSGTHVLRSTGRRPLPRGTRALLQLAIVGAAVAFLVRPQLIHAAPSLHMLWDVDSGWLPLAMLAELLSFLVYSLATRSMLPSRPSIGRMLRIDLTSIAVSHCLPDGGAAGTATCWRLLTQSGVPSGDALYAKVAQGATAAGVLQLLLLGGYTACVVTEGPSALLLSAMTVPAVVIIVLFMTFCGTHLPQGRQVLRAVLRSIPGFGPRLASAVGVLYHRHVSRHVDRSRANRTSWGWTAGWSAANWALDAAALWASLLAFGAPPRLGGVVVAFGIATTIAWIPISPSGIGLAEGLMVPTLIAFGASQSDAVLGVLTWRIVGFWLPMPLGAMSYATLRWQAARGRRGSGRALQARTQP